MPGEQSRQAIFVRWLWLVYVPLGLLTLGLVLLALGEISGPAVWLVGILAVYAVMPVRLLLETKRKGLSLPVPPSMERTSARRPAMRAPAGRRPSARPPAKQARRRRDEVSPKIRRRRVLMGLVGMGVLGVFGGLLFILGMGQASSGQMGLFLIGVGGFLMILSVTMPAFKLVDIILRFLGRLARRAG